MRLLLTLHPSRMDVWFRPGLAHNYSFNAPCTWTKILVLIGFTSILLTSMAAHIVPRVSEDEPYDAKTSSCFFQGKLSNYKRIYNIDGNICLYFHGRLELDRDMVEIDLEEIISVEGCLIMNGTRIVTALLNQIKYVHSNPELCGYKYALIIYGNPNLTEVVLDERLNIESSDVFIRMNPLLSAIKGTSVVLDLGAEVGDCDVSYANADINCTRVIGDVDFNQLLPATLQRIQTIEGTLRIENTEIRSLQALEGLKIVGSRAPALTIAHNEKLVDISMLLKMDIQSDIPIVEMDDNPSVCHNAVERKKLQQWLAKNGASAEFNNNCLRSCRGGRVTKQYLAELHKHCSIINDNLIIEGLEEIPVEIAKLEQIEEVRGHVLVKNNSALEDLYFLNNVKEIKNRIDKEYSKSLIVYENPNLKKIVFSEELQLNTDEVFVRANPNLGLNGIENAKFGLDLGETTDCTLRTLHKNNSCTRIIGDVDFLAISPQLWRRIKAVEGTLRIQFTDIASLDSISNLTIVGWRAPALIISKNKELVDIGALPTVNIISKKPALQITDNPNICHNIVERRKLSHYLERNNVSIAFSKDCLKTCDGGKVGLHYLQNLEKHCTAVDSDLVVENLREIPKQITRLKQIEKINGRLMVTNNDALKKLDFLTNLAEIANKEQRGKHALMIYGNKNLVEVQFSDDLNLTTDDIYIKLNPNLVTENIKMTALQVNISNDEGCTKDSLKEDKHCIALIGEINFNEISPREWKQIGTVEGLVHVKNSSIQNLDDLKNLTIIGWESPALIVSGNNQLVDISALLTVTINVSNPAVEISNNPNICDNIVGRKKLEIWFAMKGAKAEFNTNCLKTCSGGYVTSEYLNSLSKYCNVIKGDLVINGTEALPHNFDKLKQIQKIDGRLIIVDSLPLKFLPVFENLKEVNGEEFNESSSFIFYNNRFKMFDPNAVMKTAKTSALTVYEREGIYRTPKHFGYGRDIQIESASQRRSHARLVEISEVERRSLTRPEVEKAALIFKSLKYRQKLNWEKNTCGNDLEWIGLAIFVLLIWNLNNSGVAWSWLL